MNILVVDDSAFMRKIIVDLLKDMPGIEVAGTARNGKQALEALSSQKIDLVLMDVEMPVMGGLEALKNIKETMNTPVIMLSSLTNKEVTIEALALGANDFVEKPVNLMAIQDEWILDFHMKIKSVGSKGKPFVKMDAASVKAVSSRNAETGEKIASSQLATHIRALVIGASTGGPRALLTIIRSLPVATKVPIFIVQHMPKGFTSSFAQRMNQETNISVCEAEDGMIIDRKVYLCPGDYHMTLKDGKIRLNQKPKLHGTRPAVDYLFTSAAQIYRRNLVAVLLTGMGKDGTVGMRDIQENGGYTIAQNKETCVVFGMPRNAVENHVVNEVLDLDSIGRKIRQIVG
ncbi:protein-glutamate methylesterase/protein-glutamine glutaminase [Liquorilactobacillus uvarum]|uniref:Protein-glutamate methylesterase/protein-glutamine glutaminase n=2 Tax=Liquorilactobacillus uvarum TaxID=303240 RepID=A0A0R1Q5K4_9LACO|nr:chemotaxis response regulator protein-glutamate methylesterase [Liquorilactobacillus uvarum]AJA34411.1 two-component system chemotaxis family response regulator CheB [Liquorilactobacillus uvarum DSM 19971]KRL37589.1 chemotaxis-specific methylesterase [Liquorilactobacillus uvarum DSM 19971]